MNIVFELLMIFQMMDNGGGGPFVSGPPQQQQQQQQAGPMFQGGGRPGAGMLSLFICIQAIDHLISDPTLVQGVQKLLQMFKGNPAAGGGPGGFSDRGGPNQQVCK